MTIQNNRLNGINPLSYLGVNATQPPEVVTAAVAPTTETKGYPIGTIWIKGSGSSAVAYIYMGNSSTNGDALWPIFTTGPGDLISLSDDANTLVYPNATGNINIEGDNDTGIFVTASTNRLTISSSQTIRVTGQTTDATPVVLHSLTVPASSGFTFQGIVHGVKSDYTDAAAFSILRGVRRGPAGAPVLLGALAQQVCSDAPVGVTCDIVVSGNDIQLTVSGLLATTYNWAAEFKWVRVN